ncbi:MAG: LysM peptidoglycan-binding domain-containing protein [Nitrospirota bacterium]
MQDVDTINVLQEYKDYIIKKGDTLWDISKGELEDPFLWPKIWKENPEIKNPDLIYPDQKIKIPLYLIKEVAPKEVAPKPVEEAVPEIKPKIKEIKKEEPVVKIKPVERKYLVDKDTLISSGYIAESIKSKGEVIGAPNERTIFGKGDYAYIKAINLTKTGDRFYIIHSTGKVKHPETGAMMGYLIEVVGVAEVVGEESNQTKVKITASFSEVTVGDLLDDYYEIEQPFQKDNPRAPAISGFIVATKQRRILNSQFDIVYIDRGRKDGIEVGDIVRTISKRDIPNGIIQIISTKEKTATAIIRKCEKEITSGDKIGTL